MLRVHVVPAEGPPFERTLEGSSIVLGRASGCELVLADPFLSRNHARLFKQYSGWQVEDLGSRNGTRVDGRRIEGPTPVGKGSVIELSGSVVTLLDGPAPPAAAPPSAVSGATILRRVSDLVERPVTAAPIAAASGAELARYAARLELLNEVHAALGRSLALSELLELILDRAFAHLQPEAGVIFLRDGDSMRIAARRSSTPGEHAPLVSETLVQEVVEKGMAALVLDATTDSRFAAAHSILASGVRSLVAAPLLEPEGCHGMIVLSSRVHVRQFKEEDLGVLASLASVAGLRIRHVALAAEAAERQRLERELALARHIQEALLPSSVPHLEGWEVAALNEPSRGVSGDLYKFQEHEEGSTLEVLVADVSGKGMAAALLTATLEALAAGPLESGLAPVEVVTQLSRWLYERTPPERYATLFLTTVDLASGEVRFVNAGHNAGLLVRAGGEVEQLGSTGTPIGLLPGVTYREDQRTMQPGDLLVLYTDGITEAVDEADEEYGLERLSATMQSNAGQPLDELLHAVGLGLDAFTHGVPYHDDRTLILLRRTA